MPIEVTNERPSGANSIPSSSVTPKVTCSGVPSGKRCRQMWYPPPVLAEKYIHFPSGDQAASVHCAGAGPTGFPGELPSKGINRQGSHESRVHLNHQDLLPIGREIRAVGHAGSRDGM